MKFIIDSNIFEKFPDLNIGIIIAKNLNNNNTSEEIQKALRNQEEEIRQKYHLQNFFKEPKIDIWRKTYPVFGAKPKEHKSSVENLYRLVLESISLRHINKLVDIYNLISLKYMLPVGGEDLDKIKGDIHLAFAQNNEPPVLLLGDKDERPPHIGEVIYKDEISSICRRWNWREAERTKLTENTKNCVLVIEGLPPVKKEDIEKAAEELKNLVEKYCQAETTTQITNKEYPEIVI